MLILFPAYCDDLLSLSPAIAKPATLSITNGVVTFPHSPCHLSCPVPTVYTEELVFSRPICFELSAYGQSLDYCQSDGKLFQERLWTPSTVP